MTASPPTSTTGPSCACWTLGGARRTTWRSARSTYGAAFDNPDLLEACVIGGGEAEPGAPAGSWQANRFAHPVHDGTVRPIPHLTGRPAPVDAHRGEIVAAELTVDLVREWDGELDRWARWGASPVVQAADRLALAAPVTRGHRRCGAPRPVGPRHRRCA